MEEGEEQWRRETNSSSRGYLSLRNAVGTEKMPAGSASEKMPLPEAKSVEVEHYIFYSCVLKVADPKRQGKITGKTGGEIRKEEKG